MSFQPTENSVPDATATSGAPAGAKMSSPWCQDTSARGAPKLSTNAAGPRTGKTYGPAARAGRASEGEPKPPNGGAGASASSGGAGGSAPSGRFGRAFGAGSFAGRPGPVALVVVGGGVVVVGTLGDGGVGEGGGSGVTASQSYRWPSKTMIVPSPRPVPTCEQIQPLPLESVQA